MTDIQIAINLAQLRNKKGITQDDVAQALGISNKTVSKWENGTSLPNLSTLVALAEYYRVSTDALLGLPCQGKNITGTITNIFSDLGRNELVLKIAEIIGGIFSSVVGTPAPRIDVINKDISPIPPRPNNAPRVAISVDEFFGFAVYSENVNLKTNFS